MRACPFPSGSIRAAVWQAEHFGCSDEWMDYLPAGVRLKRELFNRSPAFRDELAMEVAGHVRAKDRNSLCDLRAWWQVPMLDRA